MYTKDSFDKYPLFKNIIKKYGMDNFLDPLTKTILRGHIMNYIDRLIEDKRPFSMMIIDIDNFKQINDNYGHHIGDLVLEETAKNIIDLVGDNGLVGRYGGDEFIIVDFVHTDYDSMHKFLESFYVGECNGAFRRIIIVEQLHLLITGTIGTANFPADSTDFDDLFNKADKALYRGKMKGRNCFIIYVESKHKDIDISKLIKEPLQKTIYSLNSIFDEDRDLDYKKNEAANYVKKVLKISDVIYINDKYEQENDKSIHCNDIDEYVGDLDVGIYNSVGQIYSKSRYGQLFILKNMLASILICKITFKNKFRGYIILGDKSVQRIWQNEDISLAIILSKLLGAELELLD